VSERKRERAHDILKSGEIKDDNRKAASSWNTTALSRKYLTRQPFA